MFKFRLWRPASVAACRRLGLALGLAATLAMAGSVPADAGWLPVSGQRFDLQLSAPFDLIRPTNILALGLFATTPERVRQLHAKGVAVVCQLTAGLWENWRPDAPGFPHRCPRTQPVRLDRPTLARHPRAGRATAAGSAARSLP